MRVPSLALVLLLGSGLPGAARAQPRPTSDDLSLIGGRTLGNGEIVLSAGLGWPGFFVGITLSPSSRFDVGIQGHVDYGAILGTSSGVGGGLSVPMRLLVYGAGSVDVSLAARPFASAGEGALVGEEGTFADDFGWAVGLEAGVRAGFHVGDTTTLVVGAMGLFAWTAVPSAGVGGGAIGGGAPLVGIEANFSRRTVFFAEALAGYAGAPENRFSRQMWLRVAFGIGYRL